ncbi:PAS domain-containing protein [Ramlibacter terrae]|uniref:PAS domain-containing protein n=1 Tax=Ramlibacter terrae TaxID=2732511 RepID=A0ABX6P4Z4_9BURK|nr:PAS domain-containing protein [Ramlibacter terrae]
MAAGRGTRAARGADRGRTAGAAGAAALHRHPGSGGQAAHRRTDACARKAERGGRPAAGDVRNQPAVPGYLDSEGIVRDANAASLAAIGCNIGDVVGKPFWETPWFTATPGLPEFVRDAVDAARSGSTLRRVLWVHLPVGRRRFDFTLRPVFNARRELIGIVPEAVDVTDRIEPLQQAA